MIKHNTLTKFPLIRRFFILLSVLAVVCGGVIYLLLFKPVPKYIGSIDVDGLQALVEVTFNRKGVPRIEAANDSDVYFTQGYLHASERMWQLELQKRLSKGELSEVYGSQFVKSDIWMNILGLYERAKKDYEALSPNAKHALERYSDGINAWIETGQQLPAEFKIHGITPDMWTPADSLAWQKVFALNLSKNMYDELSRLTALNVLTDEQYSVIFPYDNVEKLRTQNKVKRLQDMQELTSNIEEAWKSNFSVLDKFNGSNGWVISGDLTASGAPIIANDPHLGLETTSIWYASELQGDKLHVKGMSLIGIPGITIGRNKDVAWAVTNLTGDQQDLVFLDTPYDHKDLYLTKDGYKDIEFKEVTIQIKERAHDLLKPYYKEETVLVRSTEYGPIVSDLIDAKGEEVALSWAALAQGDTSFEAFFELQYSTNWHDFRASLESLVSPSLQFLYADTNNNIGMQVAGKLPIRKEQGGELPFFGSSRGDTWLGYIDFDQLPSDLNDSKGFYAAANTQVDSEQYISHDWAPQTRYKRIEALLEEGKASNSKFTVNDMVVMQKDNINPSALKLSSLLLQSFIQNEAQAKTELSKISKESLDILRSWDGSFDEQSRGATLFFYWRHYLQRNVFMESFYPHWQKEGKREAYNLLKLLTNDVLYKVLSNETGFDFCDSIRCREEVAKSLEEAIVKIGSITKSYNTKNWRWGNIQYFEVQNTIARELGLNSSIFSEKIPVSGSGNSLSAMSGKFDANGKIRIEFGANFRQVFDLKHWNTGYLSYPARQSEHMFSEFNDVNYQEFFGSGINSQGSAVTFEEDSSTNKLVLHPG
ncbi:penicillin acylase family protein [Pseudoalteromonas rhizosphaerae]|uniref:penicillin acylase family protein n=1 Tax=Pseudoalteromonas rhizosphaerae TaxID=2518973 RepID=UPI0038509D57